MRKIEAQPTKKGALGEGLLKINIGLLLANKLLNFRFFRNRGATRQIALIIVAIVRQIDK